VEGLGRRFSSGRKLIDVEYWEWEEYMIRKITLVGGGKII
jgi:hypothetical protein